MKKIFAKKEQAFNKAKGCEEDLPFTILELKTDIDENIKSATSLVTTAEKLRKTSNTSRRRLHNKP